MLTDQKSAFGVSLIAVRYILQGEATNAYAAEKKNTNFCPKLTIFVEEPGISRVTFLLSRTKENGKNLVEL